MRDREMLARLWGLVLAGGDGTRLADVTREIHGYARPKQFCALLERRTLLEQTVARVEPLVPRERVVVSTTRRWRDEATEVLRKLPGVRISEQPANAGTTPGVLLGLVQIVAQQANARVVILPSDHHIRDDRRFSEAIRAASRPGAPSVVILGARIEHPEEGLGWILPDAPGSPAPVASFIEKPGLEEARTLLRRGALANTFAMVADAGLLIEQIGSVAPGWLRACRAAVAERGDLEEAYRALRPSDLSRDVLAPNADALHVARLEGAGWSDVGTPERLAAARRSQRSSPRGLAPAGRRPGAPRS